MRTTHGQRRLLEQEAGAALVDRAPGRLELTAAGRIPAGAGARIGRSMADAEAALAAQTGSVAGPVVIAIPPAGRAMAAVAHVVPMLAKRHPGLQPTIVEVEETEGLRMLRATTHLAVSTASSSWRRWPGCPPARSRPWPPRV